MLPISPLSLPVALAGTPNGALSAAQLDSIGVEGARMERTTAARAARAMIASLRAAGHDVRHVGDYRSYDAQVSLFVSRYQPVSSAMFWSTPAERRKQWPDEGRKPSKYLGQTWWVKKLINGGYPATAATPGTSNHGLGLALDFAEELDGDPQPEAISAGMVRWMIDWAWVFGFSAELQSEPWHWRYVAGDNIPEAVYKFENPTPPNQEDEDMIRQFIPNDGDPAVFAVSGLSATWVKDEATRDALALLGAGAPVPVARKVLSALVLDGPLPKYDAADTRPKTVAADFAAHRP